MKRIIYRIPLSLALLAMYLIALARASHWIGQPLWPTVSVLLYASVVLSLHNHIQAHIWRKPRTRQ